jgi:branched-chain amino acid transport system permease protein
VHYTVNPGDDSHIKAFGVGFDAASPYVWALAAVLLIGGFLVARKTWSRVGHAWDSAAIMARSKGIAA